MDIFEPQKHTITTKTTTTLSPARVAIAATLFIAGTLGVSTFLTAMLSSAVRPPAVFHIAVEQPLPPPDNTIVVYNTNYPDALEIAQYYAQKRNIASQYLCPITMPPGHYATKDQLLGARKTIVEQCICNTIPASSRPTPCDSSNIDAVAAVSNITHMALIKGIPARLYQTGWPSDNEEPSFDYYLSYLIYHNDDIFAPGTTGAVSTSYLNQRVGKGYYPPLNPYDHRFLAYGRIEAMTTQRTKDVIDRTIAAERRGLAGNFVTESLSEFDTVRYKTNSVANACIDYYSYQPFVFQSTESSWPYTQCRTGTTYSVAGAQKGILPGSNDSHIPFAINAGFLEGTDYNFNTSFGFNHIGTMLNWHKTEENCTELCKQFPTQQERDDCRARSTDYFKDINTDCVGGNPGLIGYQRRSFAVQSYGFFPTGWSNGCCGNGDKTPPVIIRGDGYQDAKFTDDAYLHTGTASVSTPDTSTCLMEGGSTVPCHEHIALHLEKAINLDVPLTVASTSTRNFIVRIRHRNNANPGGQMKVKLSFNAGGTGYTTSGIVPLNTEELSWKADEVLFQADGTQGTAIEQVIIYLQIDLSDNVYGFFDLDGLELIDTETGDDLLEPFGLGTASFDEQEHTITHLGDYAANAIDRLGAIAWWGSSSHFLTGGHAFSNMKEFINAFFMGRTLGESIATTGNGMSGIVYGDPLYHPSAAGIYIPNARAKNLERFSDWGLYITAPRLASMGTLYLNAFHGANNSATVRWSLEMHTCTTETVPSTCIENAVWEEKMSGTGALQDYPVDWAAFIDTDSNTNFVLRLRVWNEGDETNELMGYATISYKAHCMGDYDCDKKGNPWDNCVDVPNSKQFPDAGGNNQLDTDGDMYGNICDSDYNNDAIADEQDEAILNAAFGTSSGEPDFNPDADYNGNGTIDNADIAFFESRRGGRPGPSGFVNTAPLIALDHSTTSVPQGTIAMSAVTASDVDRDAVTGAGDSTAVEAYYMSGGSFEPGYHVPDESMLNQSPILFVSETQEPGVTVKRFSWKTKSTDALGEHVIELRAVDSNGATTTAQLLITITAPHPPGGGCSIAPVSPPTSRNFFFLLLFFIMPFVITLLYTNVNVWTFLNHRNIP